MACELTLLLANLHATGSAPRAGSALVMAGGSGASAAFTDPVAHADTRGGMAAIVTRPTAPTT